MKTTFPTWLLKTLRREITGQSAPDTQDYQITQAAIAGVTPEELKSRFKLESSEILQSIRRVACEVRAGNTPDTTIHEFPELKSLSPRKKTKSKKEQAIVRIEDCDMTGLPAINHSDPGSLPEFLRVAKEKSAATLAPLTLRVLESKVAYGEPAALKNSLELLYGIGRRGPQVAIQQNFGGAAERTAAGRGPHEFESIIMAAEKADGTTGGETTVFDERLLEQQEES